MKYILLKGEFT